MTDDRRHSDRAPARKLAYVKRPDAHPEMFEMIDLSPGGMRIHTKGEHFVIDENLTVEIDVEESSLEVSARVAHVSAEEAGIEFLFVSEESVEKLEFFVLSQDWSF